MVFFHMYLVRVNGKKLSSKFVSHFESDVIERKGGMMFFINVAQLI